MPCVVAQDVESQRERAQRDQERSVELRLGERALGVEAGRRLEEGLVVGVEWPAPGPEAILYLASKGIRCVATDGPTLGGAEPKRALATYWALGSKGMVGVEFLIGVSKLPKQSYFIFAPVKVRDCHGGPGRAIALF